MNEFLGMVIFIQCVDSQNVLHNFSNSYYIFCCKCCFVGDFMIVFKWTHLWGNSYGVRHMLSSRNRYLETNSLKCWVFFLKSLIKDLLRSRILKCLHSISLRKLFEKKRRFVWQLSSTSVRNQRTLFLHISYGKWIPNQYS